MCGLFAGVGKLNSNRMIALGSMNESRGTDSVGISYIRDSKICVAKVATRPITGLNIDLRKEVTEAAVSGMFIGHTRQATQGEVTTENAHPFLMDGIAFAHNGIILNDETFGKYAVDSMSLIHGIKAKDFSKYQGPIALVWIEDGKLQAYRKGNPLFRGRHAESTYLASERDQLEFIGCTHIRELKEGFVYTFHNAMDITTKKIAENRDYVSSSMKDYLDAYSWKDYLEDKELTVKDAFEKENFNTWKDDRAKYDVQRCSFCYQDAEIGRDYCADCAVWMDKDLPKMPLLKEI